MSDIITYSVICDECGVEAWVLQKSDGSLEVHRCLCDKED
jgi:hypothetical protein